jgi:hypothetical protein
LTPKLRQLIEELRTELAANLGDTLSFAQFNDGAQPKKIPADLPADLRELLEVADGLRAGSIEVPAVKRLGDMQYYLDYVPHFAPVAENRDGWLVIGTKGDEPLFAERATGSIWYFPRTGTEWFASGTFEEMAPDLTSFLDYYAFGPGYGDLVTTEDPWYQFLDERGLLDKREPEVTEP